MTNGLWEKIAIAALSALLGGATPFFTLGPSKPDRNEVRYMIQQSTPVIVEGMIKEYRGSNAQLDKRLAVMEERLVYITKMLDDNLSRRNSHD